MGKERISNIVYDTSHVRPAMVCFQNGVIKPQNEILNCAMYKGENGTVIAAAATKTVAYKGNIIKDDLYNNFLVVRNRKSRQITLVAVDKVMLQPVSFVKKKKSETSKLSESSVMALKKQFGSKRDKRKIEQLERLKLNLKNAKDELNETVTKIEVNIDELKPVAIEENNEYRPPINRSAESLEEVYPLETLVPLDVLESLETQAKTLLQEEETDITVCPYIKLEILKLQNLPTADNVKTCEILLYVDCLIQMFLKQMKMIAQRKYDPCPYSKHVGQHILKSFTQVSAHGRVRPNYMKDKALGYILVLLMIVSNYKLDIDPLTKVLKVGIRKLLDLTKILAFQSVNSKEQRIVCLKLPLPPMVTSGYVQRKRK